MTDAKHLLASLTQVSLFSSGIVIVIGEKRLWWHYAIDIGAVAIIRSGANWAAFDGLYIGY